MSRANRNSEFQKHPSVQALIAGFPGITCPHAAMRSKVGAFLHELFEIGWEGPPFDVDTAASYRGYRVVEVGPEADQDGWIVAGENATIFLRGGLAEVRRRFTVAHEITHTLFPDFGSGNSRGWIYRYEAQSPVEQLCQTGAAEILMPSRAFLPFVDTGRWDLGTAKEVSDLFHVSLEAAARHLVAHTSHRAILAYLQLCNKPSELCSLQQSLFEQNAQSPAPKLRVVWAVASAAAQDIYVPKHKSIPDGSLAYQLIGACADAHAGMHRRSGVEDWVGISKLGRCAVDCMNLYQSPSGLETILCLLRPS